MAAPLHYPRHSPAESGAPIPGAPVLAFEPPAILTVPEVAVELRCSKAHVHNLINGMVRGAPPLPALWLGRRRLVRRCSLDEFVRANEHGTML